MSIHPFRSLNYALWTQFQKVTYWQQNWLQSPAGRISLQTREKLEISSRGVISFWHRSPHYTAFKGWFWSRGFRFSLAHYPLQAFWPWRLGINWLRQKDLNLWPPRYDRGALPNWATSQQNWNLSQHHNLIWHWLKTPSTHCEDLPLQVTVSRSITHISKGLTMLLSVWDTTPLLGEGRRNMIIYPCSCRAVQSTSTGSLRILTQLRGPRTLRFKTHMQKTFLPILQWAIWHPWQETWQLKRPKGLIAKWRKDSFNFPTMLVTNCTKKYKSQSSKLLSSWRAT